MATREREALVACCDAMTPVWQAGWPICAACGSALTDEQAAATECPHLPSARVADTAGELCADCGLALCASTVCARPAVATTRGMRLCGHDAGELGPGPR